MPVNKNTFRRYRIINGLLSSYKRYTLKEIAEMVNTQLEADFMKPVSERMIYYDLQNIQESYPVVIMNVDGKYFYKDRGDSIDNTPLSKEEKRALEMACQAFTMYKGSSFFDKFNDTVNRLMVGSMIRSWESHDLTMYIMISETCENSGQQWLDKLLSAIHEERCLTLTYKSYHSNTKKRVISPYLLKEYRNSWYVVAYAHDKGSTIVFKLSRIQAIEDSDDEFVEYPDFNRANYFRYSLGVYQSNNAEPVLVTLKFNKHLAPLIMENRIHNSMKVLESLPDSLTVSIEVYNTIELRNLILSYGDNVTVLAPQEVKDEIKKVAESIVKLYQ
jgi:predicted DNA-binding transcriptional regulator YafY